MSAHDILIEAANRPRSAAERLRPRLGPDVLNGHLGGHDNSVAWLLWHIGREMDVQVAGLSGGDEVWGTADYARKTGLGSAGDVVGFGHTPEQARAVRVDDAQALCDYLSDTTDALIAYLRTLSDDDLDEVIDAGWNPPVTRGVRLVSIIDDAAQHIGQAAYAAGALTSAA